MAAGPVVLGTANRKLSVSFYGVVVFVMKLFFSSSFYASFLFLRKVIFLVLSGRTQIRRAYRSGRPLIADECTGTNGEKHRKSAAVFLLGITVTSQFQLGQERLTESEAASGVVIGDAVVGRSGCSGGHGGSFTASASPGTQRGEPVADLVAADCRPRHLIHGHRSDDVDFRQLRHRSPQMVQTSTLGKIQIPKSAHHTTISNHGPVEAADDDNSVSFVSKTTFSFFSKRHSQPMAIRPWPLCNRRMGQMFFFGCTCDL